MKNVVSWMLRRVALVRTDVSEERIAFIIRVLVTANVSRSSILITLRMETILSSETPVFTRATRCNIPQDGILNQLTN
jgi:hypothetical protein